MTVLFDTITIAGIGHIGSSIARRVKRDGLARRVVALEANADHRAQALEPGRGRCRHRRHRRGGAGYRSGDRVRADRRLWRRGRGDGAASQAGRHRQRRRFGEDGGGARSRAAYSRRRPFRARPSRRGHRALRPGRRPRQPVRRALVHPDADARHRCRGDRQGGAAVAGLRQQYRNHGSGAPRPGAGHRLPPAAPDRLYDRRHGHRSRDDLQQR